MISDLMREFLESGVHFGHQTSLWNPNMEKYIFGKKDGIYVIDVRKTEKLLLEAVDYVRSLASRGKKILFVGTKRQAQNIVSEEAKRGGMYFVNQRWLGGTLTNFNTIRKSVNRFKELKEMEEKGTMELLSKKEKSQLTKEMERLRKNLEGIENMEDYPEALFIIDPAMEDIAVKEARKLSIPIVAITDTNCDPELIDYPIPSNDDAIKSIKLITTIITDSVLEGKKKKVKSAIKSKADEEKEEVSEEIQGVSEEIEEKSEKESNKKRIRTSSEEEYKK